MIISFWSCSPNINHSFKMLLKKKKKKEKGNTFFSSPSCIQLQLLCSRWGMGVNDRSMLMWEEEEGAAVHKVFGREAQTTPITSSFNHSVPHLNIFSLKVWNLCNFNHCLTCRCFLSLHLGLSYFTLKNYLSWWCWRAHSGVKTWLSWASFGWNSLKVERK